ncbi:hypothetical protein D3C87_863130 [compost metagenome]
MSRFLVRLGSDNRPTGSGPDTEARSCARNGAAQVDFMLRLSPGAYFVSLLSHCGLMCVSLMSHTCPIVVSYVSHTCLIVVSSPSARRRECQESAECIRLHSGQTRCPRGLWRFSAVCCRTKENNSAQGKPKKIKEMTAPGGCVVCGGFKGPAAALAAGALRAPVSVRGTLTKSEGRPRRRSRWDWTPRPKTPCIQSKGPP